MKRVFAILVLAIMVLVSTNSTAATVKQSKLQFTYHDGTEVVAVENKELSYEKMKDVADRLAGAGTGSAVKKVAVADPIIYRLNPQCAAGNHSLTYTTYFVFKHRAYSTTPRCLKSRYKVATCTRVGCSYFNETLVSRLRTAECHG